jgi:hypothetical protein
MLDLLKTAAADLAGVQRLLQVTLEAERRLASPLSVEGQVLEPHGQLPEPHGQAEPLEPLAATVACLMALKPPLFLEPPRCLLRGGALPTGRAAGKQVLDWQVVLRKLQADSSAMASICAWVSSSKRLCLPSGASGSGGAPAGLGAGGAGAAGAAGGTRQPWHPGFEVLSAAWPAGLHLHGMCVSVLDCRPFLTVDTGARRDEDHTGLHPQALENAATSYVMEAALALLEAALRSQVTDRPVKKLYVACHSGRQSSVAVAVLLGEVLKCQGYQAHVRHLRLEGDCHSDRCSKCQPRRALIPKRTLDGLMALWNAAGAPEPGSD